MKKNILKVNPRPFYRSSRNTDLNIKQHTSTGSVTECIAGFDTSTGSVHRSAHQSSSPTKEEALKELYIEIDVNRADEFSKEANFFWGDNIPDQNIKANYKTTPYLSMKDVKEEWSSYTYFDISKLVGKSRIDLKIGHLRYLKPGADFVLNNAKRYLSGNKKSKNAASATPFVRERRKFFDNFGIYARSIAFGTLALCSIFSVFSFLHHPENSPNAASMIMGQNMESKLESFQSSLLKGEIVDDKRQEIIYYIAKGENISDLALKFHLKETIIRVANKIPTAIKKTRIGQKLVILPVDGVLHPIRAGETIDEIARRYKVASNKIINTNSLDSPEFISINEKLIIPGASQIKFRPKPTLRNIAKLINSQSSFRVSYIPGLIQGVSRYLDSGRTCWPTNGSITSVYGWRWGGFHTGIDIANDYGSPIRAVRGGVIVGVGYEGGYGNMITIDHGNGMVTRYAHCSSIYVSYGQRVMAGQVIGAVGSTGYSTGPHVHFEVMLNGTHVNPKAYF